MSQIKNGGLDQYGAGPFEQQQFGTAGIERVNFWRVFVTVPFIIFPSNEYVWCHCFVTDICAMYESAVVCWKEIDSSGHVLVPSWDYRLKHFILHALWHHTWTIVTKIKVAAGRGITVNGSMSSSVYTVSQKKLPTFNLSAMLSNLNRLLLHCWKACEICYKILQHFPPHLRHVVTLRWEIKNSIFDDI